MPTYNYVRHRRTKQLTDDGRPPEATHTAVCPQGFKWWLKLDGETFWILPSSDYGTGYAFCSFYTVGSTIAPTDSERTVS